MYMEHILLQICWIVMGDEKQWTILTEILSQIIQDRPDPYSSEGIFKKEEDTNRQ